MGAFDRRKCKVLNGPTATGNHCPEGWSFYQYPGPGFDGLGENSAKSSYYSWVDQHNTFGLGGYVLVSTANLQDGLVALHEHRLNADGAACRAGGRVERTRTWRKVTSRNSAIHKSIF